MNGREKEILNLVLRRKANECAANVWDKSAAKSYKNVSYCSSSEIEDAEVQASVNGLDLVDLLEPGHDSLLHGVGAVELVLARGSHELLGNGLLGADLTFGLGVLDSQQVAAAVALNLHLVIATIFAFDREGCHFGLLLTAIVC